MSEFATFMPSKERSRVIALVGATGGCGTTTLGVACASIGQTAASSIGQAEAPSILLDLQTASGLEVFLGIETVEGLRTCDLGSARGVLDFNDLHRILPSYLDTPVLTSRTHSSAQLNEATSRTLLEGAQRYQGVVVVLVSVETLWSMREFWDSIVCVSPLTLMGAARTLSLLSLFRSTRMHIVSSAVLPPEFSVAQFEKIAGQEVLGHIEPSKAIRQAIAMGNGPLGSLGRSITSFRRAASLLLEGIDRSD